MYRLDQRSEAEEEMRQRQDLEKRICEKCLTEKKLIYFRGRLLKKTYINELHVTFSKKCKDCLSPENVASVAAARKKDHVYAKACAYWRRSKLYGEKSDLKLADIRAMLGSTCFYCETRESQSTLDRRDSNRGYTKKNTVACCFRCNTLKSDMPTKAWKALVDAVRNVTKLGLFENWRREASISKPWH